jgi:hypothetical protein
VLDELATPSVVVEHALKRAAAMAALPREAYTRVKQQLRGPVIEEMRHAVQTDPMLAGWIGGESAGAAAAILARDT